MYDTSHACLAAERAVYLHRGGRARSPRMPRYRDVVELTVQLVTKD